MAEELAEAAKVIDIHPAVLETRRLETISEAGPEHDRTTVPIIPGEFLAAAPASARARMDQKSGP